MMTTDGAPLADRIRAALPTEAPIREVPMFGGLSFMVNDRMAVAAGGGGDLLVRVDPGRSAELLALPGAAPAEMGTGRSMGPSWIRVSKQALTTDGQLSFWVGTALE